MMPQVHCDTWMVERVERAVKRRQQHGVRFTKADWQREAFREKLDRELGPMKD